MIAETPDRISVRRFCFDEEGHKHETVEANQNRDETFHRPKTDPQGSYTGVPEHPQEQPVQDADDL